MRIILVHHDDGTSRRMQDGLHEQGCEWRVAGVRRLNEALAQLDDEPADVVIADATEPALDGLQLLRMVRTRHPQAIRLVFADPSDREAVARALEVAHQALAKPLDVAHMVELIGRTQKLAGRLRSEELRRVVGQIGRLPSAPRMYMQLRGLLGDPECHARAVTELLDQDPALTSKVLQLANSAYFSGGSPIGTIAQAVLRIGLDAVRILVLANEVFDAHRGNAVATLRRRAVRASQLAARMAAPECRDTAGTAALLAYMGDLIPGVEALCAAEAVHTSDAPTPADVGAYLLAMWGLPDTLVEVVAHHRRPSSVARCRLDMLGIVHVATTLVDALEPDVDYLQSVGAAARWKEWQRMAQSLPEEADF